MVKVLCFVMQYGLLRRVMHDYQPDPSLGAQTDAARPSGVDNNSVDLTFRRKQLRRF